MRVCMPPSLDSTSETLTAVLSRICSALMTWMAMGCSSAGVPKRLAVTTIAASSSFVAAWTENTADSKSASALRCMDGCIE